MYSIASTLSHGGKIKVGELSILDILAKCPVGEMSVDERSVGKMSIGEMSIGKMSIGEMSVGKMFVGEMSRIWGGGVG